MRPPRFARALLALVADPDDRDFMLDDLDEEFAAHVARDGAGAARRWYRVQVLTSLGPALARRVRRPVTDRFATRHGLSMDALLQDLRFAARAFLRRPGFTLVALVTLAIAIGANTAIFSVVNGVLLKPLPGVEDSGRIVEIAGDARGGYSNMSLPMVRTFGEKSSSLASIAAVDWATLSVGGGDRPEVRVGMAVTDTYFRVLGVSASRGRLFSAEDARFPSVRPVAVISETLRATRYADAPIPGAEIVINGVPLTIIGVAGGGFRGQAIVPADVFIPLGLPVPGVHRAGELQNVASQDVQVIATLRPGVSREQAAEELTALATATLRAEVGEVDPAYRLRVDRWGSLPAEVRGTVAAFLSALLLLVGLLLAMACINVAGMILSRSAERGDEIAVRMAMGAGRGRITRQLLAEATLLALVAGALALPLAAWVAGLLLAFEPPLPPGFDFVLDFALDWRVLAYALAIAVGSAVLFNLAPALHASRTDVMEAIKGEGGSGRRTRTVGRSLLVAGQMAFSLVLLVTAGLFLRSVSAMHEVDPGWNAKDVYTTDLDLELTGTPDGEGAVFFAELTDRLAATPGVQAASLGHKLPLASSSSFGAVNVEGMEPPPGQDGFQAFAARVSPGYFGTLELSLLQGRDFSDQDMDGAPMVTVINRTMAERFWPGARAVGRTFRQGTGTRELELTVVGVVEDASYKNLFEDTPSFYYLPDGQWYDAHNLLFLKVDPARIADVRERVAQVVAELQPNLPVQPIVPLESSLSLALAPPRIAAWVSGVLGALGLLLGAVGVYGVTAFAVSQRVREIGIRMALGATRRDVMRLVLRQGMRAPLLGVVVGLAGALGVAKLVSGFLAGIGVVDPVAYGTAVLTLLGVALAATFAPAWRAARANPVASLRAE